MWGFKQKPAVSALSNNLMLALAKERGLTNEAAASLRMMENPGHFVNRKVTYFRVFDSVNATATGTSPSRFNDLSAGAILYCGHVEKDGQIVLNQ